MSDLYSPIDGMGEVISQRQNVMFEQEFKDEYEALESPISRRFQGPAEHYPSHYFIQGCTTSTRTELRSIPRRTLIFYHLLLLRMS